MNIVKTVYSADPKKFALCLSIAMAADKGISNEMKHICGGYVVIADDGKAIRVLNANLQELMGDDQVIQAGVI
jgi:hypothetical protein